jgi:hypothetical protein
MITLQPTQQTLLRTFSGVVGGKCHNTLSPLQTLCSMFTLYATMKQ